MTDMFYFPCSAGTCGDIKHRVRKVQFGNGYAQVAKDGISGRTSIWSVSLVNLTQDVSDEVVDFLDTNTGRSFIRVLPRGQMQGYFTCSDYTLISVEGGLQSISATFEEVFFP